jgi:hypothetical protein
MTGNRHRYLRGVALGAVVALVAAGCTRPWWTPRSTTTTTRGTPTTRTTPTTAGGGHEHNHSPRLDHPPTEEQKAAALKFVDETRAAVAGQDLSIASLERQHYVGIGDGQHWVKPEFTRDDFQLDPHHIESYTVRNGRAAAAMYIYNPKGLETTMDDVPDIAGNWTLWHDHVLSYRSNDPNTDDFFRLCIGANCFTRHDVPMFHVWFQPNACGPFAGAGVGEGSCIKELATY